MQRDRMIGKHFATVCYSQGGTLIPETKEGT